VAQVVLVTKAQITLLELVAVLEDVEQHQVLHFLNQQIIL
jgi:hypothetical protein